MRLVVCMFRGVWEKEENGEWFFRKDPSHKAFYVLLRTDEPFVSVMETAKQHCSLLSSTPVLLTYQYSEWSILPHGNKTPPVNITDNSHVCQFMVLRYKYPDLSIYVTVGPEAVASYEYNCRSIMDLDKNPNRHTDSAPAIFQATDRVTAENLLPSLMEIDDMFADEEMCVIHQVHMVSMNPVNRLDGLTRTACGDQDSALILKPSEPPTLILPHMPIVSPTTVGVNMDVDVNYMAFLPLLDINQQGLPNTWDYGLDEAMVFWTGVEDDINGMQNGMHTDGGLADMFLNVSQPMDSTLAVTNLADMFQNVRQPIDSPVVVTRLEDLFQIVSQPLDSYVVVTNFEGMLQNVGQPLDLTVVVTTTPMEPLIEALHREDDISSTGSSGDLNVLIDDVDNHEFGFILNEAMQLTTLCAQNPPMTTPPMTLIHKPLVGIPDQEDTHVKNTLAITPVVALDCASSTKEMATPVYSSVNMLDIGMQIDAYEDDLDYPIILSQLRLPTPTRPNPGNPPVLELPVAVTSVQPTNCIRLSED